MGLNGFVFLKALVVLMTVVVIGMATPGRTLAFVLEYPASHKPAQEEPRIASPGQPLWPAARQAKKQNYLPGELILKFKDESVVGAVARELVQGGQPFQEVTGNSNLDRLNQRYKVKAMRRVFRNDPALGTATGRIDRRSAELRHRQQREKSGKEVAARLEKRQKKKGIAAPGAPPDLPYLGSVYRVEVSSETNIDLACADFALDPNIAYCQPNFRMEAQWVPNDPYYSSFSSWGQGYDDLWGLKKMETSAAWDVTKGAGSVVAVVDSGVDYNHPDMAANIWSNSGEIPGNGIDDDNNGFIDDVRGWNFSGSDSNPMDDNGHGTHVAGTIAAVGDNGIGVVGVAPAAKIMPLKGLDAAGSGSSSNLAAAIIYGADNGADIINNSWGCSSSCPSNPVAEDAVRYAHDLGAVVVFAAGNSQDDVTLYSPQNQSNNVITVAASSELDTRSYFSNIGSLIDIAAPGGGLDGTSTNRAGRNILSLRAAATDLYKDGLCIVDTLYYRARGTSMACPNAAGVAALVAASHPAFTPDDVSQALRASADDIESPGFDLLSGAGRLNARKAVAITSVPRVRITSPIDSVKISNTTRSVTIKGDAYGAGFASYQMFYAPLVVTGQAPFTPRTGSWEPLGGASSQSVTDGVLAQAGIELFDQGRSYLIKLEVTTTDNVRFTDIKEIQFIADDARFFILTSADLDSSNGPQSEGERFSWIEAVPPAVAGGKKTRVGKVYDGATNRTVTIYPEADKEGAWIDKLFLNAGKIVWYETNYSYGKSGIASIGPAGELVVERTFPYELFSTDGGKILFNEGSNTTETGQKVYLFDIPTDTLSPEYRLPPGDYSQFWPSLEGTSVVTNMWYPGGVNNDVTVNLTDLPTGVNEVIRVLPGAGGGYVNGAINGPGVVVWSEDNPLMVFDKNTKEIRTVAPSSHPYSFATDGRTILYSAFGTESGIFKLNLYAYDIPTGTTTFYSANPSKTAKNNMWPSFGTKHLQWWAYPMVMVRNDIPVLGPVASQPLPVGSPFTLPVTAFDSEQDTIDLTAVGGVWPDTATALPAGATFTDNGNSTGTFQWTPTTPGVYTVTFLARDFAGRKEGAWNAVQMATFLAYDPGDPATPLAVTVAGGGRVNSSLTPDINCSSGTCSQSYPKNATVTLTPTPAAGFVFSGWSGACSGSGSCTVTMDQPLMVTATFVPSFTLDVTVADGSGSVHTSPAPDIGCTAGTCSQSYSSIKVITLSASAAAGFEFNGWSGACSGLDTCIVTMNQARSVTAHFLPLYPLSVTLSGSGTVHSSPSPDISCTTGTCTRSYISGTQVTLNAFPDAGFAFTGWSGSCTGTGSCTVSMDQTRDVTAAFTRVSYSLTTFRYGDSGAIHSSPAPDINCTGSSCVQLYDIGTVVTLTATPTAVTYFSTWTGACSGSGAACSITMNQDRSAGAIFYGCHAMISSSCFSSLGEAVNSAQNSSTIKAHNGVLSQNLNFNTGNNVTFEGGYDSSFSARTGMTTVSGLTVVSGTVSVSDVEIR